MADRCKVLQIKDFSAEKSFPDRHFATCIGRGNAFHCARPSDDNIPDVDTAEEVDMFFGY